MTATQLVQTHGNRVVSGALIVALYVSVIAAGWFLAYLPAQAAPITSFSDVLSVSVPASASNHTVTFTVPTEIPAGGSFSIDFSGTSSFTIPGAMDFEDVDFTDDAAEITLATCTGEAGAVWGVCFDTVTSEIHFESGTGVIAAGSVIVVEIGTNATEGAAGVEQLTNPAATTGTDIDVETFDGVTTLDTGQTFVAIQPQVTLQATVNDQFSFVVGGCDDADTCLIDTFSTDIDSTPTLANFGTLVAGTTVTMGSSLSVISNAQGGFIVTVEQNHNMLASNGADIDSFEDGVAATTGATWDSPAGTAGSENTYGHLGLHSEDTTLPVITNVTAVSDASDGDWFGLDGTDFATIWTNTGTGDGFTDGTGHIDIGYRVEVSGLQESGTYTNQLMYIATPTF